MLQAVCFDVDSTFCTDESIDEIASFLGVGEKVAEMTARAMGGSMKFQDALKMRLDVMNVSAQDMDRFLAEHPFSLSPGMTSQHCLCCLVPVVSKLVVSKLVQTLVYTGGANCTTWWTAGSHVNQLEQWCLGGQAGTVPAFHRRIAIRCVGTQPTHAGPAATSISLSAGVQAFQSWCERCKRGARRWRWCREASARSSSRLPSR